LKLLLVKEADYLRWLDKEIGAAQPLQTEPANDGGPGPATAAIVEAPGAVQPPQIEPTVDGGNATATPLRSAFDRVIDDAIGAVYDEARRTGADPPNVKKICPLVQEKLRREGYRASQRQIEKIASQDKHKQRRRPPGKTIASEKRSSLK
jgi:hypothetical protein